MLYDVRDAFRNILQAVVPNSCPFAVESERTDGPKSGVRSLAAICAAIIGEHVDQQIADNREETQAQEFAEDEDMEILNEYYDAVPGHFRR